MLYMQNQLAIIKSLLAESFTNCVSLLSVENVTVEALDGVLATTHKKTTINKFLQCLL